MKQTNKVKCSKCDKKLKTEKGLGVHMTRKHPYIPPPLPKVFTKKAPIVCSEERTLLGALGMFDVGDIFYIVRKYVIKELTTTENSKDIKVVAELTQSHYQPNKPE